MNGTTAAGAATVADGEHGERRLTALVEEMHDGDSLLWTLTVLDDERTIIGSTHDRQALDRVAEQFDLVFVPIPLGTS